MFDTIEMAANQITAVLSDGSIFSWLLIAAIAGFLAHVIKYVLKLLSTRLRRLTSRTNSVWDDVAVDLIDGLRRWVLFIWCLYLFPKQFDVSISAQRLLLIIMVIVTTYQVGLWGSYLIRNWRLTILDQRIRHDPSSAAALGLLSTVLQGVFLTIIVLMGLSHLGVNITALITGLGVGGIAVALAAQNILGDLFASLSIVLDKPFSVGDYISAGDAVGTVEAIGIKTTRIRTLSGEQLIVPNKYLTESRIQNFRRMQQRRVVIKFGISYSTPLEKLKLIPEWVKGFIAKEPKLRLDRCHFSGYGTSSLDFELVFYVLTADFNVFMDLQQIFLFEVFAKFESEGVDFAFPSKSIYIEKVPEKTSAAVLADDGK